MIRSAVIPLALLFAAISAAAAAAAVESADPPRREPPTVNTETRGFWAFQRPVRPEIPAVKRRQWVRNPIDAFVLAGLEAKGLSPAPPVSKAALLRRAYYDLTGLPPSPAEVDAFASDTSPNAYASVIDRLLASPQYGEKWGQHWLDLVRFAETNSYERDDAKPNVWRYRDYVIRSFNSDKPYDQFIKEQLAGDEMPRKPGDDDPIIATGYYRLGIWDDDPADRLQARYDNLDDIAATTGQVFLGLTVDCARCHDHKIDPIPQKDYYRLLAFFQNITPYHNGGPGDQTPISTAGESALCVSEPGPRPPETFVMMRGNAHVPGAKVEPGFLSVLSTQDPVIPTPSPGAKTCGRRTVLANWIASKNNPMTARVMANRVFQYHLGRGIVRSSSNFGFQGDKPTHPQLLDYLATELVANGWHLKPLHRLIMLSNAYQMACTPDPSTQDLARRIDPENDLLWRFDLRRLEAEEVRDSILSVNGTLNLKMFGPSIYPDIPKQVLAGESRPGYGWGKSSSEESDRRSIYIHRKRSLHVPILEAMDAPESDKSCPVRFVTVQPTQALTMMNSEFLNEQAGKFASRMRRDVGDDPSQQVRYGLKLALCRDPSPAEIERGMKLIRNLRDDGASPELAMKYFALMVYNLNEFVYVD